MAKSETGHDKEARQNQAPQKQNAPRELSWREQREAQKQMPKIRSYYTGCLHDNRMMSAAFFALIPAAGAGARAGSACPKQYAPLLGKPMLLHTLAAFGAVPVLAGIHVVVSPEDEWLETLAGVTMLAAPAAVDGLAHKLQIHRVGAATRAGSVLNGLGALQANPDDWVLVHDAARPCVTPALIESLIAALRDDPVGGLLALPVPDTVKRASADGRVAETISREGLWLAQTPQMFRYGVLREALQRFADVTDEAGAIERMGFKPRLVPGDARNIKVTYPADFALAEAYLKAP